MVKVKDLVEALQLETIVPARSNKLPIESSDINRPGSWISGSPSGWPEARPGKTAIFNPLPLYNLLLSLPTAPAV